jgi:hypothetical protein
MNELGMMYMEAVVGQCEAISLCFPEWTEENLIQYSPSPGRDSNSELSECEAEVLPIRL